MNALQLVNKLIVEKLRFGGSLASLSSPAAYTKTVLWALNEIQRELADDIVDWNFLKTTGTLTLVADQQHYSLASNFNRFMGVMPFSYDDDDENILTLVSDDEFKNHVVSDITDGIPYVVRRLGVDASNIPRVELYGLADSTSAGKVINYDYIKNPAELALDADVSPVPDHILIMGAYMKLRAANGDLTQDVVDDYLAAKGKAGKSDGARARRLPYRDF